MNRRTQEKQSIIVRGIAAQIQAMHMPTFQNLKDILSKFGWEMNRNQTNEQSEDENHRKG